MTTDRLEHPIAVRSAVSAATSGLPSSRAYIVVGDAGTILREMKGIWA